MKQRDLDYEGFQNAKMFALHVLAESPQSTYSDIRSSCSLYDHELRRNLIDWLPFVLRTDYVEQDKEGDELIYSLSVWGWEVLAGL